MDSSLSQTRKKNVQTSIKVYVEIFFFSFHSSVKIISVYVGWSVEQSAGTRLPPSRTLEIPSSKAGVAGTRDPSRPLSSSSKLVEAEVDRRRRTG